jgi:hypothetical protein
VPRSSPNCTQIIKLLINNVNFVSVNACWSASHCSPPCRYIVIASWIKWLPSYKISEDIVRFCAAESHSPSIQTTGGEKERTLNERTAYIRLPWHKTENKKVERRRYTRIWGLKALSNTVFGGPRDRWEDNIKIDYREIGSEGGGYCEHGNEPSGSIKGGEFLD